MSFIVDSFTDTSGTSITAHNAEAGGAVTANTAFVGSAAIISNANRLRGNFSGNTIMEYAATPPSADYDVQADLYVASISSAAGLCGRSSTTAGTYYLFDYESGSLAWNLYAISNGSNVAHVSQSASLTIGNTYTMKLSMRGSTINAYVNGVLTLTIVDTTIVNAGTVGFFFGGSSTNTTTFHLDNFSATTANTQPVTNTNLYFSPGNWFSDGLGIIQPNNILPSSTFASSTNPGAYLKFNVNIASSGYVLLNVDTSPLNSIVAANCPRIAVSIDGGALTTTLLSYSTAIQQISLSSTPGYHSIIVWFQGVTQNSSSAMGDRWTTLTTDASVVKTNGIELDPNSTLTSPTVKPYKMLVYGDSITEGCDVAGSNNGPGAQDATNTYAIQLANTFNAEVGIVGWASQGYEQVGYGNVPVLSSSYNFYSSGNARRFISYDIVIDNHGTNGTTTAADVSTMLANYRAICPNAVIFKVVPFGQVAATNITTGVSNYKLSNPTDNNVFLINTGVNYVNGTNSNDNLHPNVTGHTVYASALAPLMSSHITTSHIMAIITKFSSPPTLGGLLGTPTVTGASPLTGGAAPSVIFQNGGQAVFEDPGWNYIYFQTNTAVLVTNYQIWLGEDVASGNRAVSQIALYGSTMPGQNNLVLLDSISLSVPYYSNYAGDSIMVTGTLAVPTSVIYFKLGVLSHDWGIGGDGARVYGFQVT